MHLVGPEVVVATQVLLAVLDFDLELLGGSGGGDLRAQRLAPVEGVVELLEAAVLRLSLALLALRNGDRHRLLLVYILPGTLQRTMARALVSWMGRQIRFPAVDFFLLKLGSEWAYIRAKVTADSQLLLVIIARSHEIVYLIDFPVINAKGITFIPLDITQIFLILRLTLNLIIVVRLIAC